MFRPALRHDSKGVTWSDTNMGQGQVIDVLDSFYVAQPGVSAATINAQLQAGKHIIFTPGLYLVQVAEKNGNHIVKKSHQELISEHNNNC